MNLEPPAGSPPWMFRVFRRIEQALTSPQEKPFRLKSYTVATLPDPFDWRDGLIIVSDETGGAVPAFSDGTDWRRITDRAVVS